MAKQIEVVFAGFGGQGVMTAGQLLAYAAMEEGKQVVWIPSYGPEMRGGTANCTVVVSDSRIGSPIINNPMSACVFNRPSLDKFGSMIRPGGLLLINSSLIDVTSGRDDIKEFLVPANDIAMKAGNAKVTNMVMLAAYVEATSVVSFETLLKMLDKKMGGGKMKNLIDINHKAIEAGRKIIRQQVSV
ncbi:MAG: 2-oxoacid:ferredoxin oxidoreductase subunit gamma [candidate division Zixibacteria bacterium HGW-Zixibacteria-1]|nr:MAG: 2-oxoacid:ferredoxin oxidoreductase subunit gamma [candidate division Zixibacteria bacterium HGW-Zixibacteria-1]